MSTRLFGRQVVVQLGTTTSTGREYSALRVAFKITMSESSAPNTARIEVYNLTQHMVATMQQADAVVRLLAGYRTQGGARLLFQGNPIPNGVQSVLRGPDRVLVIEAQDGGREYTTSHVSRSYATGTNSGQVFADLADDLGVPLGNVAAVVQDVSFPHGLVLHGRVADQLDRIADLSAARWQIRDGTLQVWAQDGSTGEAAVVFSAQAGNLVGSPSPTDNGVEITGLLAPTLRPGKPFRVQAREWSGDYVTTDLEFKGDSGWSSDFYVVARGRAL